MPASGKVRMFDSGATRDTDDGKYEYSKFLSPKVLRRFAEYMHRHRIQPDGNLRDGDNWKKGIPEDAYMASGFRHFMDWWAEHEEGTPAPDGLEEALCALIFNAMGYLYEILED